MSSILFTAPWAVRGTFALISALALAGCDDAFGKSPPHAAPANPLAEGADGRVDLRWNAVEDATSYTILWRDETTPGHEFTNQIKDIETTTFSHTGLVNLRTYRYRIAGETGGGRGPESVAVSATPGPVPGPVEWTAVTSQNPGHTIHFATATNATHYRIYFASAESQLLGRRPIAFFNEENASPHVRPTVNLLTPVFYRVIAMNDDRIGVGGPIVVSPTHAITQLDLPRVNTAWGDTNNDGCADTVTSTGTPAAPICGSGQTARVLADVGLGDLLAAGRTTGDSRFADFTGDENEDLFSNTLSPAGTAASIALLHVNQANGNFQTSAGLSTLAIGGFGGTLLAADFDNDGDIDLFAPNDHTRGDGARNWLLINDGGGVFTDTAAAAGVDTNPVGAAYVPRGGQAVDFNEDGFVDLLFGSRLMLNDGDGTFSDGSVAAGMPVQADEGLKLFDVDLDGDLDLLHLDGSVTRLYRNTAGVFDAGTIVNQDILNTFGRGLNACDVNGDGFEDVLIANNLTATGIGLPKLFVNVAGTLMSSAVQREVSREFERPRWTKRPARLCGRRQERNDRHPGALGRELPADARSIAEQADPPSSGRHRRRAQSAGPHRAHHAAGPAEPRHDARDRVGFRAAFPEPVRPSDRCTLARRVRHHGRLCGRRRDDDRRGGRRADDLRRRARRGRNRGLVASRARSPGPRSGRRPPRCRPTAAPANR